MSQEDRIIREILEKSGFPLELEVASIVEKELPPSDWWISYNDYYWDEEESKGREIDLALAFYVADGNGNVQFRVSPTILLECKKCSDGAWIFFVKKNNPSLTNRGQYFDTFQLNATPTTELKFLYTELLLDKFDSQKLETVATSYCQVRLDKPQLAEKSQIFEATRQLVKATRWEYTSRLKKFGRAFDDIIFLIFPTIVLDGRLYEGSLSDGSLVLNPTEHVVVRVDYQAPSGNAPEDFYIDVVSRFAFSKWLQETKNQFVLIRDIVNDPKLKAKRSQLRRKLLLSNLTRLFFGRLVTE